MNFLINKYLKTEDFNPTDDKIAIVIKEFTLKKNPDWPFRYSEPYIVSMAIDQSGANNPAIDFNILPFPQVRKGDTVDFGGQGHLIYGPSNPGEFVAYSVLFMESDSDMRQLGENIEKIVKSEAVNIGMKELLKAVPTFSTASMLLLKLSEIIAGRMKENRDDQLFRRNGTLLRDVKPPYDVLRTYIGNNDYIESKISIIPLTKSLGLGKDTKRINL